MLSAQTMSLCVSTPFPGVNLKQVVITEVVWYVKYVPKRRNWQLALPFLTLSCGFESTVPSMDINAAKCLVSQEQWNKQQLLTATKTLSLLTACCVRTVRSICIAHRIVGALRRLSVLSALDIVKRFDLVTTTLLEGARRLHALAPLVQWTNFLF